MARNLTDRDLKALTSHITSGADISTFRPKPRKKRSTEESDNQCLLIQWWDAFAASKVIPKQLLFSIPNGGYREVVGVVILKREGLRPGVCDLFLSIPRRAWHGLYIEMKTEAGEPSDGQLDFIQAVIKQGYRAEICRSFTEARDLILNYLS